jgi:hypothetical protein
MLSVITLSNDIMGVVKLSIVFSMLSIIILSASMLSFIVLDVSSWTNFSWQDEPWAEFSTLEVAACHTMHLLHSIAI